MELHLAREAVVRLSTRRRGMVAFHKRHKGFVSEPERRAALFPSSGDGSEWQPRPVRFDAGVCDYRSLLARSAVAGRRRAGADRGAVFCRLGDQPAFAIETKLRRSGTESR